MAGKLNFVVDDDAALEWMASTTNRRSKADVVRDALSLYQFLLQKAQGGQKVFIGPERSEAGELHVKQLEEARSKERR